MKLSAYPDHHWQNPVTVTYKLEQLDRLVTDAALGTLGNKFILSEEDGSRILYETLEETEKLKELLVREIFSFSKEKEIEIYIKNYQTSLTHVLDRLYYQLLQLKDPGQSGIAFYQNLFKLIQALLSFIEERFSKYFDKSAKVPDVYLVLTRDEIQEKLGALAQIIKDKCSDDPISTQIAQKLVEFVAPSTITTLTYRDIMFYKELVKELEDLSLWERRGGIYSGLQQLLIYLNYNDKEFINGLVNQFKQVLQSKNDLNDKIDRLLIYSKEINQLQLKPDTAFLDRHPSVKNQLSNWFAEELAYLERKLKGLQTSGSLLSPLASPKPKVVCHLPVDQLGILFRAAADIKIISTSSQKVLFDHIAPWLSTLHRSVLSAESMRSKSYSPEKKDQEALKDILMQLFRQVGKY